MGGMPDPVGAQPSRLLCIPSGHDRDRRPGPELADDIVEWLAEALDRDEFVAAASVMADRIEYTIGEQR